MGLFSPWFLAGLAAIGLPIWLHLLRRFTRTPRPFSSLMFFERRIQSSTRHRRLRYLTLLAMRIALLSLLVLAFANPYINRKASAATRRTLNVMAIDRSFSMRAQNRMNDAKAEAHRILAALPGSDTVQVLAFDSHVEALTQPDQDKLALHAAIDSIAAGDAASSYGELSRTLRVLEQTSGMRLSVLVVTDAQKTSLPASFADLQVGPHTSETVRVVGKPVANWAVENVSVPARVFDATIAKLTATVSGWNGETVKRKVSVFLDAKFIASKDVTVPPCGRSTVEFDNVAIPFGLHRGEVRIEPGDDLPNDDRSLFTIERADPGKVLFLYSAGRARDAFYYKSALDASPDTGLRVQPFPLENISDAQLSHCALVVLNDPAKVEDNLSHLLAAYVTGGGSLLIGTGPATARSFKVPIAEDELVPTTVTQGAGHIDNQSAALLGVGQLENVEFVSTPRISPKPSDRILARFADGSPLLLEQRLGEGAILLFASTLDNATSDFPLHTSFLPFVAQTATYLSGGEDTPSSVVANTAIALRETKTQTTAADVVGPEGKHELSLGDATRAMSYNLNREGFYEIQRANGRRALLAVHADRRESDLTPIPAETLALWRTTARNETEPFAGQEKTTVPWSLWRYVLLLALIAATVESLFASRYLKQERETL